MTERQKHLARNALGLPNKTRTSYRNRFAGGTGHADYADWQAMTEAGHAECHGFSDKMVMFSLTESGARLVLTPKEKLDKEDFPQARKL